ncbi:MAG: 4-hydroxythreonine-4-phosphate dehydrogenase PdxA [Candidatus Omnitrophica bacterium CG11_big_fil_rev_8_21_14_0_20_42_13]|uniref:4-hydroxythreonine-4-phosphate dehydrogenase PdxA n=1 Tax=Candidatus Ghiorseimicrobium undicola TaxID=1974746 RepID=A0A2H0LVD4_9BACT|nr:MAG: 4-hydroxythreonine-4-phosphate dehydrogenase PdxA [Candidatus Omnitrophica bacterium CG11_big_fil_rev_8_21_14_0_20_42_13]
MRKCKIIITMGDPSGIGPEVVAKALRHPKFNRHVEFIVVGDKFVFDKVFPGYVFYRNPVEFIDLSNVERKKFSFGKIKPEYGKASLEYIDTALDLIKVRNNIGALVTAPVNKESVSLVSKEFYGHTEYLAMRTRVRNFAMLLVNNKFKIALVTRHASLESVARKINKENIRAVIRTCDKFFRKFYSINKPNIGVCALNPHASDHGLFGTEEQKIIIPALKNIGKRIRCRGPYPADTLFSLAQKSKFDVIVAMYHDQALIPLKLTDPKGAANITMGLPFTRTSPLHGTAMDIAGRNKADASSMISAIGHAANLFINEA